MSLRMGLIAGAMLALTACTTTGNIERNAAGGALIGAAAGAVIGNNTGEGDAGQGAAIGAGVGAVAGAARGYGQDQRAEECRDSPNRPLYRDERHGGFYYYVPGTNRTCWENGSPR